MEPIVVYKGRTCTVSLGLGIDVSNDIITSQVREQPSRESELVAEWTVTFLTDGTDGECILTMDDSVSGVVTRTIGYMDVKRQSAGEPLNVFDEPIEVQFRETITV